MDDTSELLRRDIDEILASEKYIPEVERVARYALSRLQAEAHGPAAAQHRDQIIAILRWFKPQCNMSEYCSQPAAREAGSCQCNREFGEVADKILALKPAPVDAPTRCAKWIKSGLSGYRCALGERFTDPADCIIEDCPNRALKSRLQAETPTRDWLQDAHLDVKATTSQAEAQAPTTAASVDAVAIDRFATKACEWLCELPDRTSPEEEPDMCLVTPEELHGYLVEHLTEWLTVGAPAPAPTWKLIADEKPPYGHTVMLWASTDDHNYNWKMATGYVMRGFQDEPDYWTWDGRRLKAYDIPPTHWQHNPKPPASAKGDTP